MRPTSRLIHLVLATGAAFVLAPLAFGGQYYTARYSDDGHGKRQLISEGPEEARGITSNLDFRDGNLNSGDLVQQSYPRYIAESQLTSPDRIVVLRSKLPSTVKQALADRHVAPAPKLAQLEDADEVITLVDGGPPANRINMVFMGDGYTRAEHDKFVADIQRLVHQMFDGEALHSYLPLYNVYAVFRASNESGIGKGTTPKDTAFGLYRDGDTLRAIYATKTADAHAACNEAPGCDYPILIANDPYYGGLGGEFSISTSSERSGIVVLRHELGHSVGLVGEEYDGGGYFGANNSGSAGNVSWPQWASATDGKVTAEPQVARFLDWPWYNLSKGAYTAKFTSDGKQAYTAIRISASGNATDGTFDVKLDDQVLDFTSPGTLDRTFYNYKFDNGLTAGNHKLTFAEAIHDGDNWVSNLTVHEFGANFHWADDYIGAFPVFNTDNSVAGYRPTNESCVMRNMLSTRYCKVCQENNWLKYFGKIHLIDAVTSAKTTDGSATVVSLASLKLGQLRTPPKLGGVGDDDGSRLVITWLHNGTAVPELAGQTTWTLPNTDATGKWEVQVEFQTPEVRHDPSGLLKDSKTIAL